MSDTRVVNRASWFPAADYSDGSTGWAWPGLLGGHLYDAWNRMAETGEATPEDLLTVGGSLIGGGVPFAQRGAVGSGGGLLGKVSAKDKRAAAVDRVTTKALEAMESKPWLVRDAVEELATLPPVSTPYPAYHGSEVSNVHQRWRKAGDYEPDFDKSPVVWASDNPNIAATYANFVDTPNAAVTPVDVRFKNPFVVDARGREYTNIPTPRGHQNTATTDELAAWAASLGHDGMIVNRVKDSISGTGRPSTVFAALKRGTIYSPITGEQLYSGGTGGILGALLAQKDARQ